MSQNRKILIIEDDTLLVEELSEQLLMHEEFDVISAETASTGLAAAKSRERLTLFCWMLACPIRMVAKPKLMRKAGITTRLF